MPRRKPKIVTCKCGDKVLPPGKVRGSHKRHVSYIERGVAREHTTTHCWTVNNNPISVATQ
jgi:hypothetical protein